MNPTLIPFVAFEHYMLADDWPTHSMTCHMHFWFTGKFDRNLFEKALKESLPRHPIFQMTVVGSAKSKTREIYWKPVTELTMPFISWAGDDTPIDEPPGGVAQDITKEIGLRLWIRESLDIKKPQTMLRVQFHHSVCDGLGIFQFVEDLLTIYGTFSGLVMPPLRKIDSSLFPRRGDFSISRPDWKARRHLDLARAKSFIRTIARPLASPDKGSTALTQKANPLASERIILEPMTLEKIRSEARAHGASVNDLLLRDLFYVLAGWNAQLGKKSLWTRIAVATSLRGPVEEHMSAANIVSMVFLSRKFKHVFSADLLPSIICEMKDIKDNKLGMALPRVMMKLGQYAGGIYRFLHLPACSTTAVLTNLGRPFANSKLTDQDGILRVGDITLDSLESIPPVRPRTSASFSVNYYGGALSITLKYDSTHLTKQTARRLLERYCDQLKQKTVSS
jgi:NRPS condensation-like uncharacterized protein